MGGSAPIQILDRSDMKVALDLRCVHAGLTGIGRYAANLYLSLKIAGDAVEIEPIITPAGASYLGSALRSRSHVVTSATAEWETFGLPDLLRSVRADVYHSPLFILPTVRVCATVLTVHDVIPLVRPDLCPPDFLEFFRRNFDRALGTATHVVTVSEHSRSDLLATCGVDSGKVTSIHEPVSPLFQPGPNSDDAKMLERLRLQAGFILSVGAIDRRKNLGRLLDAYRLIQGDRLELPTLVLVGSPSGDGLDIAAEVQRRGLTGAVRALGRVPDETLAALYRQARVFVFPSLYEGFGLPVVEAMASGTPVVASSASSIPEVAGSAAILVNPEDPGEIASALIRVLADEGLRTSLVERGLAQVRQFSLARQGERLCDLYRRIIRMAA
jgi:glycosyltransferase involved in cell wall biosynthesis